MIAPEYRDDPITGRRVIIAPERGRRPIEARPHLRPATPVGDCPFCEGREFETPAEVLAFRETDSTVNGPGWRLRVTPNRFPAVTVGAESGYGVHEVIIESPRHETEFALLSVAEMAEAFAAYRERIREHRANPALAYVLAFKNSGPAAGASLEHVHSQVIALPFVPDSVADEVRGLRRDGGCAFCDLIARELEDGVRVIATSQRFVAVAAFAGRFAYETWVLPRRHQRCFGDRDAGELSEFAGMLKGVLGRMDAAADATQYNLVMHTAPNAAEVDFHWHLEILPRVNEAAGFEWGSGVGINPVLPEDAAAKLRLP